MIQTFLKENLFAVILAPFAAFLIFANLGNQYLWYDESETAVLAESILQHGYPKAFIGDFRVTTDETYGIGSSYIAQPWLQDYTAALAFLMFGKSNFSARILFAVIGFLSLYLLYYLAKILFKDRIAADITLFIASTCVPYILHFRQCRYYSLNVFFTLILLISYFKFVERKRYSSFLFVVSAFLLFHSNYGCLIPTMGILFVHFLASERQNKALLSEFIRMYVMIAVLILPWAFVYKIWEQGGGGEGGILRNAKFYLSKINGYFFPFRFLLVLLLISFIVKPLREKLKRLVKPGEKTPLVFLASVIAANWVFLFFVDYNSARYIVHIAGLFFIIDAYLLSKLFRWNKLACAAAIAALCFTDLFNSSIYFAALKPVRPALMRLNDASFEKKIIGEKTHEKIQKELNKIIEKGEVKSYFFQYLYEITHDYDGPMEGVVKYLNEHAKPGEVIKTHSFNANDLFFYTKMKIDFDLSKETYPEWFFFRDYWTEDSFYETQYFKNIEKRYERIELDYPDIRYENRPDDMSYHHFKTAPLVKKVALYRKKNI